MAEEYLGQQIRKLSKEEMRKAGNCLGEQFTEWNDVFDILSHCRKCELSEVETWCILSTHFILLQTTGEPKHIQDTQLP